MFFLKIILQKFVIMKKSLTFAIDFKNYYLLIIKNNIQQQ